jgi:hypothetical protein
MLRSFVLYSFLTSLFSTASSRRCRSRAPGPSQQYGPTNAGGTISQALTPLNVGATDDGILNFAADQRITSFFAFQTTPYQYSQFSEFNLITSTDQT